MATLSPSGGMLTPAALLSGWTTASTQRSTVTLQQLTAVGMRNLAIPGNVCGELMDLYFKLVLDGHVVYVSEIARSTLNPVWMPFQPEEILGREDATENLGHLFCGTLFDVVVVRVRDYQRARRKSSALCGKIMADVEPAPPSMIDGAVSAMQLVAIAEGDGALEDKAGATEGVGDDGSPFEEEILNVSFNIRELDPLPVGLTEVSNLPLNTCLLEFSGRMYVKREVIELLVDTGVISSKHSRRKGSAIQLKEYSLHDGVDNLERIRGLKKHIEDVTASNAAQQEEIRGRLHAAESVVTREHQRTELEDRIRGLRRQVAEKREALERIKLVMQDERRTFETDIHIPKALLSTMQMSIRYKDEKQGILERRCEVLRAAHKIRSRQAMLVKELSTVYPIEYIGAGEYSIRGIKIANADLAINGRADEEQLSTALGYIAHLTFMLSKYLQVNLRYRIVPYSSRSYLRDEINDPHGEYPLFRKGVEKERFERAIFFLRKDVEQLLFARGLDPTQGAPILGRLKALIDAEATWLLTDRDVNVGQGSSAKQ